MQNTTQQEHSTLRVLHYGRKVTRANSKSGAGWTSKDVCGLKNHIKCKMAYEWRCAVLSDFPAIVLHSYLILYGHPYFINQYTCTCSCYPHTHARGKVINYVAVSTKNATSWDQGTWATCKHNKSIEFGEKVASVRFKSMDTAHEGHKFGWQP
jgi:hypothetical protein